MDRVQLQNTKLPEFIKSGSTLLDLALGGGWGRGRMFNIVGDKSTGKTLIAIEAFANCNNQYPGLRKRYAEAESAFDESYAEVLGFPSDVERPEKLISTVEDFRDDLYRFINPPKAKKDEVQIKPGGLYILDSLDALSDSAEVERVKKNIKAREEGKKESESYGATKAKELSEFFRVLTQDIGAANCALGIVSQIRDKIGVMFGETKMRTGGHAMDFYATHVVWLSEVEKITRTALGVERVVGIKVHFKVKKNKIGFPFRVGEFPLIFGYGIDDEVSMIEWMQEIAAIDKETAKTAKATLTDMREKRDYPGLQEFANKLQTDTTNYWKEIDAQLAPPIRKYSQTAP